MNAPPARVAVVMLTPACDMACPYCGADEGFGVLSPHEARSLMLRLKAQGFESVVLGGGEPLLWPGDLRELCAYAKALGLVVQVGSNLQRLPPGAPAWPEVDRWVLPLESDKAKAHDALRPGDPSHHALVLAALDLFFEARKGLTVSSVARADGQRDLDGVAAFLRAQLRRGLRLHAWHVYRFQAMGRGGSVHGERYALSDAQWDELAVQLRRRHGDLPLILRPDMLHSKQVAFFWAEDGGLRRQGPGAFSERLSGELTHGR